MITIKNLTKIYKTKKGVKTKALDNISTSIEDTGMVFILGKSGAGKSTFLNVLGGLDGYDDGEINIKGKSSKNFSESEFDSLRNTYIGFIFQEYNLLDEFTVSENIKLALELQGKATDKETIQNILNQVDLNGYGNRKPNTLSGGQKQRVAIARALIKDPEIIMADEPTGALDSKTGEQVLSTLKKLSKEKLVFVVSHDRDFAERYADRIIELADGKIISDVYKHYSSPEQLTDGVSIIDGNILTINKGHKLNQNDAKVINEFLANNDTDIIISRDIASNKAFKKFSKITENNKKETFKDTSPNDLKLKQYDDKSFKLIKSKLPFKNSFKLGASGLKIKKFKLFITIIIASAVFALFGIADTMASYDKITAAVNSIYDNNINYMALQKQDSEMLYGGNLQITDTDINNLNKQHNSHDFKGVYEVQGLKLNLDNIQKLNNLYLTYVNGAVELNDSNIKSLGYNITGKLPENNNEIAISKYTFLILKNYGYGGKLTNENSILNKDFSIQIVEPISEDKFTQETVEFKIVGVIDTKLDLEKYKDLEKIDYENMELKDFALQSEFMNVVGNSYHNLLFMNQGFFKNKFKTENYQKGNYIMALSPIGNRKDVQALVKAQYNDGESSFRIKNAATDAIYNFGSIIEVMADVFVKIGIVFALLALLLLSNFIGTSISYKKREIGVLRAIGARSWDVFGIFFNESLLISLINYTLSIVFSIIACNAINNAFRNQGFIVTLLNFGIRQALIMLAIGLVAAFLSTLFPVLRRARMKPVDAIKK